MPLKAIICFLVITSLLGIFPQRIVSETIKITEQPISAQIDYFATLYGTDSSVVKQVVECESNGYHGAVGDGGRSKGIAQFQKPTWDYLLGVYKKKYNEELDYKSSFDQIKLLTFSIAEGHGNRWTAFRAIMNGGKYSFYSSQLKKSFVVYCKLDKEN